MSRVRLIWLATWTSLTAHTRPSCGALSKRATFLPEPKEVSAEPDPDREGWVTFRYVANGRARLRSARLCSFCGGEG